MDANETYQHSHINRRCLNFRRSRGPDCSRPWIYLISACDLLVYQTSHWAEWEDPVFLDNFKQALERAEVVTGLSRRTANTRDLAQRMVALYHPFIASVTQHAMARQVTHGSQDL